MINEDKTESSEGWSVVEIRELIDINYGKGLKESARLSGDVPVYGSNGIVGQHDRAITKGPTIILGRKGSIGKVHFSEIPCWPIDTTYFIDEFNGIIPQFFVYAFRQMELEQLDTSTAIPGLNRDDLYRQSITLPPLKEQKRIVAKIEELLSMVNAVKERLNRASQIMKRFRQAVLSAAYSGRLTEGWREEHPELQPVSGVNDAENNLEVENSPEKRIVTTVARVATVKGGKRLPKGSSYSDEITPFPYIRVVDLENMSIDQNNLKYISAETRRKIARYIISKNDVYISIAGSIGKVGLIPDILDGANLTENAAKLSDLNGVNKEYLCFTLNSLEGQRQIEDFITSSGQPKLALFRIERINIPIPPIIEQSEIVHRVKTLFNLADVIEKRIKAARLRTDKLTQSILAKAFRGELIPTEAELARQEGRSYEPASVLLERVKAERERKPSSPRRGGSQ